MIVEQDLELGFLPDTAPPPQCKAATDTLLQLTLLRFKATRARKHGCLLETSYDTRMEDLAKTLKLLLNGDWAMPRLQHFCWQPGCCNGRQVSVCVDRTYAALVEAWFDPLSEGAPSVTRWHTQGPCLAEQSGGMLCHQILPRALAPLGLQGNDQPQPLELTEVNEEGMDCWRVHTTKKLRQCLQALEDQPTSTVTWCTGLIATEPVDYMSARLQHLDATQGFGLKELVASRGLLHDCLWPLSIC